MRTTLQAAGPTCTAATTTITVTTTGRATGSCTTTTTTPQRARPTGAATTRTGSRSTATTRAEARHGRLTSGGFGRRSGSGALRRQDEQQSPVVVVRRKDVGLRRLRPVALRVNGNRLVEHAHAPLERCADVVVAALEVEPQHFLDRAADDVRVAEAGELAGASAGADQAALLVADEERRVGGRVVVVEQLEDEAEAALRAAARAVAEAGRALAGDAAVTAVGADEVGHAPLG